MQFAEQPPIKRSMQKYYRLDRLDLPTTLTLLKACFAVGHRRALLSGRDINVNSMRLRTFALTGAVCVCCGLPATHFALERCSLVNEAERPHLNLWGVDAEGEEVLFTQDHIQPRSKGGPDTLENSQTMCSPCNFAKRDTWNSPES